jgi:hypothetical protein
MNSAIGSNGFVFIFNKFFWLGLTTFICVGLSLVVSISSVKGAV